jgi:hypothetical protein
MKDRRIEIYWFKIFDCKLRQILISITSLFDHHFHKGSNPKILYALIMIYL